jgi:hypothetical protein
LTASSWASSRARCSGASTGSWLVWIRVGSDQAVTEGLQPDIGQAHETRLLSRVVGQARVRTGVIGFRGV